VCIGYFHPLRLVGGPTQPRSGCGTISDRGGLPKSKGMKMTFTVRRTSLVNPWTIANLHIAAGRRPAVRDLGITHSTLLLNSHTTPSPQPSPPMGARGKTTLNLKP
jgi:hypothetical protein